MCRSHDSKRRLSTGEKSITAKLNSEHLRFNYLTGNLYKAPVVNYVGKKYTPPPSLTTDVT